MSGEVVAVDVGGIRYSLSLDDIQKYPGSFFEIMIKKEWNKGDRVIPIAREGSVFKYIHAYLICGQLPRDRNGEITLDAETLEAVKAEADFFGLEELSKDCNLLQKSAVVSLQSYMTMRRYISEVKDQTDGYFEVEYAAKDPPSDLLRTLSEVWCPFCLTGYINSYAYGSFVLFKSSTFNEINVEELLAHATQSAFGHGTETVTDTSVRNSFEIPASELPPICHERFVESVNLMEFAYTQELELRLYKLVIYKEGGHFDEHRDTVRGEGHIGTLVVILNSYYEGGELIISHNGRTETVTGAYNWVAMYGDCLHKINPVTSGTRVSLIYDIYSKGQAPPHTVQLSKAPLFAPPMPPPLSENADSGAIVSVGRGPSPYIAQFSTANTDQELQVDEFQPVSNATHSTTNNTSSATHADTDNQDHASDDSSEPSDAVYSTQSEPEEDQDEEDEGAYGRIYDPDEPSFESAYWSKHRRYPQQADALSTRVRGISAELSTRVASVLNEELKDWDVIIITLSHLYPECQTSPAFLKGGDRALYDLLSEQFDVEVVAATIFRRHDPQFAEVHCVQGSMFSPAVVEKALRLNEDTDAPRKRYRVDMSGTKLVIPNLLNSDNVLDYSPYMDYTGNESQAEETVYIVAGLQGCLKV